MIEDTTSSTAEAMADSACESTQQTYRSIEKHVRSHPLQTVLGVVAVGFVIGLAFRASRPEPTLRERFTNLIEEFEDRLQENASSVSRRAGSLASEGRDALGEMACDATSSVKGMVNEAVRRFRKLLG